MPFICVMLILLISLSLTISELQEGLTGPDLVLVSQTAPGCPRGRDAARGGRLSASLCRLLQCAPSVGD